MFELPLETPAQECLLGEIKLRNEIEEMHGKDSILFEYGHVSKEKRWALMAVSDIWVITSLRQGYTLVKREFIVLFNSIRLNTLLFAGFSDSNKGV